MTFNKKRRLKAVLDRIKEFELKAVNWYVENGKTLVKLQINFKYRS